MFYTESDTVFISTVGRRLATCSRVTIMYPRTTTVGRFMGGLFIHLFVKAFHCLSLCVLQRTLASEFNGFTCMRLVKLVNSSLLLART